MFCSPFLTHGRGLKLLSLPELAEVSEWVSPGMGRHLQAALPRDRPGSRTAQRPSTVARTSAPCTPVSWQQFLLESTGLPSSCSLSFLVESITTQLATLARGQQRVTDPNLQGALGVGFNRLGNCLVKTPAPQPTPAPPDAADPRAASAALQRCPLQSSTQGSEVHTQGHPRAAVRGRGRLGPRQRPHPPLIKGKILKKASFTDMSDHCGQSPCELLRGHFFF